LSLGEHNGGNQGETQNQHRLTNKTKSYHGFPSLSEWI
jgi:hypothetical protein